MNNTPPPHNSVPMLKRWMPGTLLVALITLVTTLSPELQQLLQFDTNAIGQGELWRFVTGHLTHWNFDHFFWDFIVFVVLGVLCERRSRAAFLVTVATSAIAISAYLLFGQTSITVYRGLSGIDTALFCLCCLQILTDARERNDRTIQLVTGCAFVSLGCKTVWELTTQSTVFVDHASAEFIPVTMVHVAGGLCGIAVAIAQAALRFGGRLLRLSVCESTAQLRPGHRPAMRFPAVG